jgi:hypothetical protein
MMWVEAKQEITDIRRSFPPSDVMVRQNATASQFVENWLTARQVKPSIPAVDHNCDRLLILVAGEVFMGLPKRIPSILVHIIGLSRITIICKPKRALTAVLTFS